MASEAIRISEEAAAANEATNGAPAAAEARPLRLLIVDDEAMLRSVISEFIEVMGLGIYAEAADGQEALEYLRAHPVDCVLSDIRMPHMNLEDLLEITRAEFPDLAVIATSGMSDLHNACRILEAGALEFLAKPLNLDHLEQTLEWLPERRGILETVQGLAVSQPSGEAEAELRRLRDRVDNYRGPYEAPLGHAIRVFDLVGRVLGDEDPEALHCLRLAALLHELGNSTLQHKLASAPKKLTDMERLFIRQHYHVCSRLLERCLDERHPGRIIRHHLGWAEAAGPEPIEGDGQAADWQRLSTQLGLLNAVDALLHDRPDRRALTVDEAKGFVRGLNDQLDLKETKRLLGAWPRLEEYYRERLERQAG